MIPVAENQQSAETFRKNRDKILKLIKEVRLQVPIPPEYDGVINWENVESDAKQKMPELREKLPQLVSKCTGILAQAGMDGGYGVQQIVDCVDAIGSAMNVNAFELGMFMGVVESELQKPFFFTPAKLGDYPPLLVIIQKIHAVLTE